MKKGNQMPPEAQEPDEDEMDKNRRPAPPADDQDEDENDEETNPGEDGGDSGNNGGGDGDEDEDDEQDGMEKSLPVTVVGEDVLVSIVKNCVDEAISKGMRSVIEESVANAVAEGIADIRSGVRSAVKKSMAAAVTELITPRFEAIEKSMADAKPSDDLMKGLTERLDEIGRSNPDAKPPVTSVPGDTLEKATSSTLFRENDVPGDSGFTEETAKDAQRVISKSLSLKRDGISGLSCNSSDLFSLQSGKLTPARYLAIKRELESVQS